MFRSDVTERGLMEIGQVDKEMQRYMTIPSVSSTLLRDLYGRMLLTRLVDDYTRELHEQGRIGFVASCRGHEAAQVGSAICIEIGRDFTLPYYRDLGVVLTIGMTPYEVFRTYLQIQQPATGNDDSDDGKRGSTKKRQVMLHWGYHKHNTVTGPAPVATQILHAAGIAFACKLRKAHAVTIAYCGDGATDEADFLEGIRFAAHHQLPVVFICEQDCTQSDLSPAPTSLQTQALLHGLTYHRIDSSDVIEVYTAMQKAMRHAREGNGPILLEMCIARSTPEQSAEEDRAYWLDPLTRCQHFLQEQGAWDFEWASQLHSRLSVEVEQAMQDALRDTP